MNFKVNINHVMSPDKQENPNPLQCLKIYDKKVEWYDVLLKSKLGQIFLFQD
jgi:hypothetical protein